MSKAAKVIQEKRTKPQSYTIVFTFTLENTDIHSESSCSLFKEAINGPDTGKQ